jgi:hypothetical protein
MAQMEDIHGLPHFEDRPTWKDTINLGDILRSDQQSLGKSLFESLFRGAETCLKKTLPVDIGSCTVL